MDAKTEDALRTHPCYNEDAHAKFARIHLPVASECNIRCNYCNRKYDCSNESRPGVTSEVLTPQEAADKVGTVLEKIPELKVAAIAGPGDPLANEETFETMRLIRERFPDLTLCVSTNGLALPDNAQRLYDLGVRFLTVTMNAVDTAVSEKIYGPVTWNGKKLTGEEAAERLLKNQLEGIEKCIGLGMAVKINTVLIPGVNDAHIPALVRKAEEMNAYVVNILPLIPVEGTPFSGLRAPTPDERRTVMENCSGNIRMMRHCRQCRADAVGLLDNDRSGEFVRKGMCGSGCGPNPAPVKKSGTRIAVASCGGIDVNRGFGNAGTFMTFVYDDDFIRTDDIITEPADSVYGDAHRKHISGTVEKLSDFDVVIVAEIGAKPMADLSAAGKKVVVTKDTVKNALDAVTEICARDRDTPANSKFCHDRI